MLASLTVDVICSEVGPAYRVYVNEDLLTERNYRWNSAEMYVKERIEVDVPAGDNTIRILAVNPADQHKFTAQNLTVNGVTQPFVEQFSVA